MHVKIKLICGKNSGSEKYCVYIVLSVLSVVDKTGDFLYDVYKRPLPPCVGG